jgi:hypothetical protein
MPAGASSFVAAAALHAHRRLVDPAQIFCDRLVSAPLGQHEERVVGLARRSGVDEEIAAVRIDLLLEALDGILEIADLGIALGAGDVHPARLQVRNGFLSYAAAFFAAVRIEGFFTLLVRV